MQLVRQLINIQEGNLGCSLLYKVLLNHPELKEFWIILSENNLLSYDGDAQTFKITKKGLRFLRNTQ